jgi:hypothetical protein
MPKKVRKIIVIIFAFTLGCIITFSLTTNAESQLASERVGYDNTNSGSTKTTVKDAIDELYVKANACSNNKYKCKRATLLHTERCANGSSSDNYYCYADGYTPNKLVTYGSLGTEGTLTSGDAFDCDVNGDGIYNASTERFYYVSDYYDTSAKRFNNDYAVLIYYSNVSGGKPSNSTTYAYDSSGTNNNGPVTAIKQLPTTDQWSNVSLLNATKTILTQTGTTSTSAGTLPDSFSYTGYAARLLTYQEVYTGCYDGSTAITSTKGLSSKCQYLMENTYYTSSACKNYWLETPNASYSNSAWRVSAGDRNVSFYTVSLTSYYGVRPAIEILKSDIEY